LVFGIGIGIEMVSCWVNNIFPPLGKGVTLQFCDRMAMVWRR